MLKKLIKILITGALIIGIFELAAWAKVRFTYDFDLTNHDILNVGNIEIGTGGSLTIDTMTLSTGSITDTTGAIGFGNENLTTTGTITGGTLTDGTASITGGAGTGFTNLTIDNININGAVITSDTGAISFGNENLTTTGSVSGNTLISTVAAPTAPLTVASNTLVTNLNADLLDGISEAAFGQLAQNETISGNWVNTDNPWADNEVVDGLTVNSSGVKDYRNGLVLSPANSDTSSALQAPFCEYLSVNSGSININGTLLTQSAQAFITWTNLAAGQSQTAGTTYYVYACNDSSSLVYKLHTTSNLTTVDTFPARKIGYFHNSPPNHPNYGAYNSEGDVLMYSIFSDEEDKYVGMVDIGPCKADIYKATLHKDGNYFGDGGFEDYSDGAEARSEYNKNPGVYTSWYEYKKAFARVGKFMLNSYQWYMAGVGTPDPDTTIPNERLDFDALSGTSTTVDADSAAAQAVLNVADTAGYAADNYVLIGEGTAREEIKKILSVQAGVSLTMTANLTYEHTGVQADVVERTFQVGETVTGDGGATGTVTEVSTNYIKISGRTATQFVNDETITGGTSTSTAAVNNTDGAVGLEPCQIWNTGGSPNYLNRKPEYSTFSSFIAGNNSIKTGTAPKAVSTRGCYNCIGNVWEWVDLMINNGKYNNDIALPAQNYITDFNIELGLSITTGGASSKYHNDYFYINTSGLKAARRSGDWGNGAGAGLFALHLYGAPSNSGVHTLSSRGGKF